MRLPASVIVLGLITGMTYGLLSVGLVLVYRANRIINFAHGEVGAFAVAVFGLLYTKAHIPYYVDLPIALALAAATGALAEVAVIRRLRKAPLLMSVVATLGIAEFLVSLARAINSSAGAGLLFPEPPGLPIINVGALRVTRAYTGTLFFTPILVIGLAIFLRRSRFGLAMRGAAANPEAARMAGVFAGRMSSLAWAIAGVVSAFTAILVVPSAGFTAGVSVGPGLLVRALVGAALARMTSLPRALMGGLALGVVENVLLYNYPKGGVIELVIFGIILVALLVQGAEGAREEEKGSWASIQPWAPLPLEIARLRRVRLLGPAIGIGTLAIAAALPIFVNNNTSIRLIGMYGLAMVALSVGVASGLGGELSLGQFALAGIGAMVSFQVSSRIGNFPLALFYAGLAGAGALALLGLPALRVKGLFLTVTTLSFAIVVPAWFLRQPWALGDGADPGRPIVFGRALETNRAYYYFVLAVFVVLVVLARNVRRTGFGRLLVSVRDNEDNARAFGVSARRVKLQGYLLAGFIAGVGGAAYGHSFARIGFSSFPTAASLDVVVMTVIGGVGLLAGPMLGALLVVGLPTFVHLDNAGLAASKFGLLIIILYTPGGIAQMLKPLRDLVVTRLAGRSIDSADVAAEEGVPVAAKAGLAAVAVAREPSRRRGPLLEAVELTKRYGGLTAVDGVSLEVAPGETVGLIGPNGAGKTTLFEMLGGFNRPDRGRVYFDGREVTALGPEDRAGLGLIRSFQDAALFPTMTVLDSVALALERTVPTNFLGATVGLGGRERNRVARADELVGAMGLRPYRDKQVKELSTGTRRITELACLLALEPTLLLLDEPSSGIAQRETEALAGLLRQLTADLGITLLIIEHDIPLVTGLADRIVAMDAGQVIAVGPPDIVRNDPAVVEAYLGGSLDAIQRSGERAEAAATGANGSQRRRERARTGRVSAAPK